VYYIDGKIDFMVGPVDALPAVRYARLFRVLLDKDRAADASPPVELLATDPPTAASFRECIHWFYAAALMRAKCVVRDEPWQAKFRDRDLKKSCS